MRVNVEIACGTQKPGAPAGSTEILADKNVMQDIAIEDDPSVNHGGYLIIAIDQDLTVMEEAGNQFAPAPSVQGGYH